MSARQPRASYKAPTLHCNLIEFLPEGKNATDTFLQNVCTELMKKSRAAEVTPVEDGVVVTFVSNGLTPVEASRFTLAVDEIATELINKS